MRSELAGAPDIPVLDEPALEQALLFAGSPRFAQALVSRAWELGELVMASFRSLEAGEGDWQAARAAVEALCDELEVAPAPGLRRLAEVAVVAVQHQRADFLDPWREAWVMERAAVEAALAAAGSG